MIFTTMLLAMQAAAGPTVAPPFSVGEKLEYRGKFGFISAGSAVLEVAGIDTVRGVPSWRFDFTTEVSVPLYRNRSLFTSWTGREDWIALMPENRRHGLLLLYDLFDTAYGAWCEQLAEVVRLGRAYPEIARFQQVPGIGEVGSHVFSAMIEDPHRFRTSRQLLRFCALGITSRSSDGKPLGYERIDRTGRRELKTVAYHAWRTGVRAGQPCDAVRRFYLESKRRTGTARHARLNTERKILTTLWSMWRHDADFDPERFLHNPGPPPSKRRARRRRRTRSRGG